MFLAWQRSKTSLAGQPTERERKALALVDKLTPTLSLLQFGSIERVVAADEDTLTEVRGVGRKKAARIRELVR